MNYKFTLFTPCYNGAKVIRRVFDSVESQTYTNFEWIIVNDGSKDSSKEIIEKLIEKSPVRDRIRFINQENQGKHTAWRNALEVATGDLWLPSDCDDSFLPETLEFFNGVANKIDILNNNYSGINVCCYDPDSKKMIGTPYPTDGFVSDNIELQYKYHIAGEHWGCLRIDVMRMFPFPTIKGAYYNENYLWFSFVINGYKNISYNKALRAYFFEPQSLCNDKSTRFNRNRSYMWLHYSWWEVRKAGPIVMRYSIKGYINMWKVLCKNAMRYMISIAKN